MLLPAITLLLLLASVPVATHAADQGATEGASRQAGGLAVSGQWMRALAAGLPAAGYFTLANGSELPARLIGARSADCGSLTLHQTIRQHTMSAMSGMDPQNPAHGMPGGMPGMSMMQPVDGVPVAAHGTIRFMPGGYHLMCEQPTGAVRPGQNIPVTLLFEPGGSLDTVFPVRSARGR